MWLSAVGGVWTVLLLLALWPPNGQAERSARGPKKTSDPWNPYQPNANHYHHHHHHSHRNHHHRRRVVSTAMPRSLSNDPFAKNRYETWPERWQTSSLQAADKHDADELPPYVKKYNRRNRKLFESLEQRPDDEQASRSAYIVRVRAKQRSDEQSAATSGSIKWLQANLFEQQRTGAADARPLAISRSANELPPAGNVRKPLPKGRMDKVMRANEITGSSVSSSRLNNFQFHRVATPKLIGAGSHGMIRKQILPFVAITDRRLTSAAAAAAAASAPAHKQPDAMELS